MIGQTTYLNVEKSHRGLEIGGTWNAQSTHRTGAKQDGVLRSHRVMPDGTLRDTVVYSIVRHEWPAVRNDLKRRGAVHRQVVRD